MSKHIKPKTVQALKELNNGSYCQSFYMPKKPDGSTWMCVKKLRDIVVDRIKKDIFSLIDNSPVVIDHIKDPKTGLFVKYRHIELEVNEHETDYSKEVSFCIKLTTSNLSYRAINQFRRYSLLNIERFDRIVEAKSKIFDSRWIQEQALRENNGTLINNK